MTSFATHDALAEAVAGNGVNLARSSSSLRLTSDGTLFLEDGRRALAARAGPRRPDLRAAALRRARALPRTDGVRTLFVCNVDNVGATLDPALAGLHRSSAADHGRARARSGRATPAACPCAARTARSRSPRPSACPTGFPHETFPLFNTNTLWIDVDALEAPADYTWCVARKRVDGREAIQLERLVGELTWWNPSRYVHVPREGARRASCRSRIRAIWRPPRSRSRPSAASGSGSTSRIRYRCRGERRVRKLYGSCEPGADDRSVRDHQSRDQLAYAPQPRPRRLFAVPLAADAAVTATTISEPVNDPTVLVFVEPAGTPFRISGTSNGGTDRLDLRCEGAGPPWCSTTSARTAAGVWTTRSRRQRERAVRPDVLPARRAAQQRRHQPHRLPGQARAVPALAYVPPWSAAPTTACRTTSPTGRRSSPGARSGSPSRTAASQAPRRSPPPRSDLSASAFPCAGFVEPEHRRAARASSSTRPTPSAVARPPRSSAARSTRSGCSRRRPRSRPTRARASH